MSSDDVVIYKTLIPELRIGDEQKKAIQTIGPVITRYAVATNTDQNSQSQFEYLIEDINGVSTLGRRAAMKQSFRVTMTGSDLGAPIAQLGTNDGARSFPIQKSLKTLVAEINGAQVWSSTPEKWVSALERYIPASFHKRFGSSSPCMPDQFQDGQDYAVYGSNRNPLAFYGANTDSPTRGSITYTVVSNTNTEAVIDFTVTEYLLIGGFGWDGHLLADFGNINSLRITGTWSSDLSSVWSSWLGGSSGGRVKTFSVALTGNSTLQYVVHELNREYVKVDPRRQYIYNCPTLRVNQISVGTLTAGQQTTVNLGQVNPSNVPAKLLIYAMKDPSQRVPADTDTFCRIDNLEVTKGNDVLVASATLEQLYAMSLDNGYQGSFMEFSKWTGSVVMLDVATLGNRNDLVVGEAAKEQFSFGVTMTNMSAATRTNINLYVVEIHDGYFGIDGTSAFKKIGVDARDVQRAKMAPLTIELEMDQAIEGGSWKSFWRSVKRFGRRAGRTLGKAAKGVVGVARAIDKGAEALGYGYEGGAYEGGSYEGGALEGGCGKCEMPDVGRVPGSHLRQKAVRF